MKRFKTIWKYAKRYKYLFALSELCIIVSYSISIILPFNFSILIDRVLYGSEYELLSRVILNYICLFVISFGFNLLFSYVWQTLSNRFVVDIKTDMYKKILQAKASQLADMNVGDYIHRIDSDSDNFLAYIQRNIFHFANSIVLCIVIVYSIWEINKLLSIILIIAAVLPIIATKILLPIRKKYANVLKNETGIVSGILYEFMNNFMDIKLMIADNWANSKFKEKALKLIHYQNKDRWADYSLNKITYLINLTCSIIIYILSVNLILEHKMSAGIMVAIINLIGLLHKKLNWILRIYSDLPSRNTSINRVIEVLNLDSETDGIDNKRRIDNRIESIVFQNVSFNYNDQNETLSNISFELALGRNALVGESGSGKTTIAGLMIGLWSPISGKILLNGVDINTYSVYSIRQHIGLLSQEVFLFNGSLRDNILMGKNNITDETILELCRELGLEECIISTPNSLDTIMSRATDLSKGQKQRIMIARLLLRDTDVLIFDEAVAALDIETEKRVFDTIYRRCKNRIVLVISHRFSTIKGCDKIIVLNNGKIETSGTHNELIRRSKTYTSLFGEDIDDKDQIESI